MNVNGEVSRELGKQEMPMFKRRGVVDVGGRK